MGLGNLASMARIDHLTLAIAEDSFGDVLADVVKAVGDVDHVMVFAYSPRQTPRNVVNCGRIDGETARTAADRFCDYLYLLDPNYSELRLRPDDPAAWFDCERPELYCEEFRNAFFAPCHISDLTSFAVGQDGVIYYVLFLRTGGFRFAGSQRWLLKEVGEMISAHIRKHFSHLHAVAGREQFLVGRVMKESPVFATLTPREAAVCTGILTGHTSESMGINLGISINSVLTYRKRLYEKLSISSQNELFVTFINAMLALSRNDTRTGQGLTPLHREDNATPARDAMKEEALMAEGLLF
ncbi:helix-turn-helix transcriptional regulator [Sphingomonas naphthae]|uniref:Helix-turn-helix transcriptional regulator n=1 Tax=Sphingomonas naphthae TaxID=1813468 RepID=A0ABY7TMN0_9SPHN|nr:helix-turn-helix transcriptional regulator [Sphingomonas naphthae]WCT74480.1 helix-turn-helix transcriptional regulator [Sphingomonas naphthae]